MQVWPAIDIRGGNCVRLVQGDYGQETVYGNNPADMAARWVADGAKGLHIVDLDGARNGLGDDGKPMNLQAIARIAREVDVPLQIGGGIRNEQTIECFLEYGIKRFVVGTRAIKDPDWIRKIVSDYPDLILIGIDARDGMVATDGWERISNVSAIDFATEMSQFPVAGIIYTDISRDGMLQGPNVPAMAEMQQAVHVPVIASGGVATVADVAGLAAHGLAGCIVGRALYEGNLTLPEAIAAAGSEGVSTS